MLEERRILVVDDEVNMQEMLADLLKREGAVVTTAGDLKVARERLAELTPEVVLLDLKLPDGSGMDLLAEIIAGTGAPAVIMISAFGTVETAVKAVRSGAFDFVVKPFNIDDILRVVRSAILAAPRTLAPSSGARAASEGFVGNSEAVREVLQTIENVAGSDASVIIRGESGTGKELVARAIHLRSPRHSAPLMPINCAAIPEPLLESELFGYEKGAFSGAQARHAGKIEAAEGGTVFLDEVGDMSPSVQSKLLRTLEENVVYPVGSTSPVATDVRFVAATNRDLEAAIESGDFRQDLYFRLNVLSVVLPPLRERPDDISVLAEHFAAIFAAKYRKPGAAVRPDLLEEMVVYAWPGNVRELRNVIEKLVLMGDAALAQLPWRCLRAPETPEKEAREEPASAAGAPPQEGMPPDTDPLVAPFLDQHEGAPLSETIKAVERAAIVRTLNRHGGNRRAAAKSLGISYKTLFNKLNEHQISVKTTVD